jgi:hypothetical protein
MKSLNILDNVWHFELTANRYSESMRRKYIYSMPPASPPKTKQEALRATGTFNARFAQVRHPIFQRSEFFDRICCNSNTKPCGRWDDNIRCQAAAIRSPGHYLSGSAALPGAGLRDYCRASRSAASQTHSKDLSTSRNSRCRSSTQSGQTRRPSSSTFRVKVHPRTIESLQIEGKKGLSQRHEFASQPIEPRRALRKALRATSSSRQFV